MGRTVKKRLDYFRIEIDFMKNESVVNLYHTFGSVGFYLYIALLSGIYRCGDYRKSDEIYVATLAREFKIFRKRIVNWIRLIVNGDLFNKLFYNDVDILTNFDILRRYFRVKLKHVDKECIRLFKHLLFKAEKQEHEANKVEKRCIFPLKKSRVEKSRVEKNINTTTTTTTARATIENEEPFSRNPPDPLRHDDKIPIRPKTGDSASAVRMLRKSTRQHSQYSLFPAIVLGSTLS